MDLGLLALIFTAALLGPALSLAARGAAPVVVGQLLAGVILGKTGLRIIDPGKSDLVLLYDLGFATLMFTVGMHVPLHDQRLRAALRGGLTAVAVAVPLSLAAGFVAHLIGGGPALVYTVVIVSSSAAVALPVIDETGLGSPPVLTAMAWITIADILATVAIPLALTPSRAGHAAVGALIVAGLVGVVFLAAERLRPLPAVHRIRREGELKDWAIDLRVAVIVLVTLSYVAEQVGASLLMAGFGTGLVVGAVGGPERLSREVLGLGQGFLVPLFFVLLGAKLDLRALADSGSAVILAVVLAGLAIGMHVLVSVLIRAPAAVGLLASAQIGVPSAVIALGLPIGAVDQGQASAIFCAALASIGACSAGAAILRRTQTSGGTPAGGGPPGGEPRGGRPRGGEPRGGRPRGGRPRGGEPSGGRPTGGEPSGGRPRGGEPSGGEPRGGEPRGGKPSGGKPSGGKPSGGKPRWRQAERRQAERRQAERRQAEWRRAAG
jgi:Kef-type K+ transport system membrane component KefB